MEPDSWSAFGADLTRLLADHSARSLAARTHWGKTTVADVKSGQRRPSARQLADLLLAVGVDEAARARWSARFEALGARPADEPISSEDGPGPATAGITPTAPALRTSHRPTWALVAAVVFVVLVLVVLRVARFDEADPPVGGVTAQAGPLSPSPTPASVGTITAPTDGASVSSRRGVSVEGTAHLRVTDTLWLVDRDPDGLYTADTVVDTTTPGQWSAVDAPVGDADDLPERLTILLVAADDRCAALLRRKADADDSSFDVLPAGCAELARVGVVVDRP